MNTAEWVVWALLATHITVLFTAWSVKKRGYKKGAFYDTREVITLLFVPRFVILASALLIIFLLVSVNKLHLLWIYVVTYWLVLMRTTREVLRADERRLREETERQETTDA